MDDNLLTILEVANQLGISKQTVYKKLDDIPAKHIIIKDNVKYLTPKAIEIVKGSLKSKTIGSRDKDNKMFEEISKVYEGRINDLLTQVKHLTSESEKKDKLVNDMLSQLQSKDKLLTDNNELMKNMQVLLNNFNKKQIVENIEQNRKWWRFWDKKN